jgi:hypothetical protein
MRATPILRIYHTSYRTITGFQIRFWSGARDLNPGPYGPELLDISSKRAEMIGFRSISPTPPTELVQIGANLQPDYYMKYYRPLAIAGRSNERMAPGTCQSRLCTRIPHINYASMLTKAGRRGSSD